MHIKLGQKIIDKIRGKKQKKTFEIKKNVYVSEIDVLFEKFQYKEFEINGQNRKYLADVNAMQGVTEMTLTLLCKLYPNLEERNNIKILNIGCGLKNQNNFLRTLGFKAYGIDFDIKEDKECEKFHDLNSQEDIPFPEKAFDCIICQEIIEHLENPWLLFRKIKKVLKLNGYLIITTPNIVSCKNKEIFNNNYYGFYDLFNEVQKCQHINPIPYWEMMHIANYNKFDLKTLTGNWEYYVEYDSSENELITTLQANDILVFVFQKMNNEIELYKPIPMCDVEQGCV